MYCFDLDELREKVADRTEWQCLVKKLGETTGEVDDSDESTTEAEDYYYCFDLHTCYEYQHTKSPLVHVALIPTLNQVSRLYRNATNGLWVVFLIRV